MSYQFLLHPPSGGICFGQVREAKSRDVIIPAGEIRLARGQHRGPNSGFGAKHIWAEHQAEMAEHGLTTELHVPDYVALIIASGTALYYDPAKMTANRRILAVRSTVGKAILEFRDRRGEPIWSVVTAYSDVRAHGTRIGTVR